MQKTFVLSHGLAVRCPLTGRILLAPHRRKGSFEAQLRNSGWTFQNRVWRSGGSSPDWFPPEPVPNKIEVGVILPVWVLVHRGTNEIEHVHWYDSQVGARRHFAAHHFEVVDTKE